MLWNSPRPTSPAGTADAADVFNLPPKTSAGREFSVNLAGVMSFSALSGMSMVACFWSVVRDDTLVALLPGLAAIVYSALALILCLSLRKSYVAMLKSICDERMAVDNYRMAASTYRQRLLELERINRMFKSAAVDIPYAECEILPFNKRVH